MSKVSTAAPTVGAGRVIPWLVVAMVSVATGLNFLDRQVLSFVIIKIQKEFDLSAIQYGWINTSFLIGYAVMFTVGGRLMDVLGGKRGLALAVGVWSVVTCLHGAAAGFAHLVALRFLLGIGEGGCFPGAVRTVCEWFREKDRALANGIAIGGSAIGAVLAPPIAVFVSVKFGWRMSFVVPGLIGVAWVVFWLLLPRPSQAEAGGTTAENNEVMPFRAVLTNRHALTFMLIRVMLDPVMLYLMFWAPKYLNEQRAISFEKVGAVLWIPYLALGVSNVIGGWISDALIARGWSINAARKTVMGAAAFLTTLTPLVAFVRSYEMAVALMAVYMFAHGLWITNYVTSISDMFGKRATATVMGLAGTTGSISGFIINPFIGKIVQEVSYTPMWVVAGAMYPLAFVVFLIRVRRIHPVYVS